MVDWLPVGLPMIGRGRLPVEEDMDLEDEERDVYQQRRGRFEGLGWLRFSLFGAAAVLEAAGGRWLSAVVIGLLAAVDQALSWTDSRFRRRLLEGLRRALAQKAELWRGRPGPFDAWLRARDLEVFSPLAIPLGLAVAVEWLTGGIGDFGRVAALALCLAAALLPLRPSAALVDVLTRSAGRLAERGAAVLEPRALAEIGGVSSLVVPRSVLLAGVKPKPVALFAGGELFDPALIEASKTDGLELNLPAPLALLLTAAALPGSGAQRREPSDEILAELAGGLDCGPESSGVETRPVLELPYEIGLKRRTAVYRASTGTSLASPGAGVGSAPEFVAFTTGAPESVLALTQTVLTAQGLEALDYRQLNLILDVVEQLAGQGFEVRAFACRPLEMAPHDEPRSAIENRLTFLGLAAFETNPSSETAETLERLRGWGIETRLATPEHPFTAMVLGRALGFGDRVHTGVELERLGPAELHRALEETAIFARILPGQRRRLVQSSSDRGHSVAFIAHGPDDDGVCARARVGAVVGRDPSRPEGTGLALVSEEPLTGLCAAVEEGRRLGGEARRGLLFLSGTAGALLAALLLARGVGLPTLLEPAALVWLSLAAAGLLAPAMAVAGPRPASRAPESLTEAGLFSFWSALRVAVLLGLAAVVAGAFAYHAGWSSSAVVFIALGFGQAALAAISGLGAGSSEAPEPRRERGSLLGSALLAVASQLVLLYQPPLSYAFGLAPPSAAELVLGAIAGLSAAVLAAALFRE